jgi:hypothetical protein
MPIRIASRLFRNRHGTFYFRLLIPNDLRACLGRRELRLSLGTEQRHQALLVSMALVADLPRLMADLREMAEQQQSPSTDFFRLWIEEKKRNITLRYRVDKLQLALTDAEHGLALSVPTKEAQKVASNAYTLGRLKGKIEMENALAFPPPPEKTRPISELLEAYLRHLKRRISAHEVRMCGLFKLLISVGTKRHGPHPAD